MNKLAHISVGLLIMGLVTGGQAKAADQLMVKTDQTQLLTLAAPAGVAVVGNPSIADVTVKGQQVFVHGRAFGLTNLIILDADGNQLANFDVTVQKGANSEVAMFKAGNKSSYICLPDCETALQVGDEEAFFERVQKQITGKVGVASGTTGEQASGTGQPPVSN
jgi:Pilus formation protein N terminal region